MRKELLESSFDFSIRLMELVKYLQEEGKVFPLSERLLLCGVEIGVNLRTSALLTGKDQVESQRLALRFATECDYILDIMVKTSYLTEIQSRPIRADCKELQQSLLTF